MWYKNNFKTKNNSIRWQENEFVPSHKLGTWTDIMFLLNLKNNWILQLVIFYVVEFFVSWWKFGNRLF